MVVVPKAESRWTVTQVYDDLSGRILTGQLRPGEALSEIKMAAHYGLSRTPVRQAFHRLSVEGLLSIVPQVGSFVAPIQLSAVRDAQFVRQTVECRAVHSAALATGHEKERVLNGLLKEQARIITRRDHYGFFSSDEDLHRALMLIAGHPHVWDFILSMKTQLDRLRYLSLESQEWLEMIFHQHEQLVKCVLSHDADGAVALMETHLHSASLALEKIAVEHAEFFEDTPPQPGGTPPKSP
ncbi:GntR family transcriptional regulator [Bosea sp. UNC402CLCol]|uniref:GntR family transcriptional regulator n=1 Tax=Bosea sp. UNC402CLCol TaxID=1510531 RepID=UPI00068AB159|nr:GntR family transcriptional regulator [Bosea sp. UNC402CLCol]